MFDIIHSNSLVLIFSLKKTDFFFFKKKVRIWLWFSRRLKIEISWIRIKWFFLFSFGSLFLPFSNIYWSPTNLLIRLGNTNLILVSKTFTGERSEGDARCLRNVTCGGTWVLGTSVLSSYFCKSETVLFYWSTVDVQCCVIYLVYISILFQILFHYRLLPDTEYSSLCCTIGSWCSFYI